MTDLCYNGSHRMLDFMFFHFTDKRPIDVPELVLVIHKTMELDDRIGLSSSFQLSLNSDRVQLILFLAKTRKQIQSIKICSK